MMNRREALSRVALIMGGTVLGAEAFLSGCTTGTPGLSFSKTDLSNFFQIRILLKINDYLLLGTIIKPKLRISDFIKVSSFFRNPIKNIKRL